MKKAVITAKSNRRKKRDIAEVKHLGSCIIHIKDKSTFEHVF